MTLAFLLKIPMLDENVGGWMVASGDMNKTKWPLPFFEAEVRSATNLLGEVRSNSSQSSTLPACRWNWPRDFAREY
ncbi:hypothetical protein CO678_16040 [Bradyrhizobium diazoefficiens]|nr:hypothetical protein CO678_16040 [Bradyrhizobium diazoefficiens]